MTTAAATDNRLRAYAQFVVAVIYFFIAEALAHYGAQGMVGAAWFPLVDQALLVLLLLLGYATMGFWFNRQSYPAREQGWPFRNGWPREAGIGLAIGWAVAVLCVLPMALDGGIAMSFSTGLSAWRWLALDAAFFALMAMAEEIAFRGYAFQRFVVAVGPMGATLGFAAYYAIVQSFLPNSGRASFFVALALGVVLSTAYLRTRALWLSWGLNFGWKASRGLIFGLAVTGLNDHSPVVQGNPMGPFWVTGGGFGLDGTWIAFVVLLAALPLVFRVTRELDFRYNAPEIVPAGIPVDLDAAARAQHQAAMGPAPESTPELVQIAPVNSPAEPAVQGQAEEISHNP